MAAPEPKDGVVPYIHTFDINRALMVRAVAIRCQEHNWDHPATWPALNKEDCYHLAGKFFIARGNHFCSKGYSSWALKQAEEVVAKLWPELE